MLSSSCPSTPARRKRRLCPSWYCSSPTPKWASSAWQTSRQEAPGGRAPGNTQGGGREAGACGGASEPAACLPSKQRGDVSEAGRLAPHAPTGSGPSRPIPPKLLLAPPHPAPAWAAAPGSERRTRGRARGWGSQPARCVPPPARRSSAAGAAPARGQRPRRPAGRWAGCTCSGMRGTVHEGRGGATGAWPGSTTPHPASQHRPILSTMLLPHAPRPTQAGAPRTPVVSSSLVQHQRPNGAAARSTGHQKHLACPAHFPPPDEVQGGAVHLATHPMPPHPTPWPPVPPHPPPDEVQGCGLQPAQ